MSVVQKVNETIVIDGNELFSQTMCIKRYATPETIAQWNENQMAAGLRWKDVFHHFASENIQFDQILKLVQFALALPGTNAPVERVFSLMNDLWTEDKYHMTPDTVASILLVRVNIGMSCMDFHKKIKGNTKVLQSVHISSKYKWFQRKKEQSAANATVATGPGPSQESVGVGEASQTDDVAD